MALFYLCVSDKLHIFINDAGINAIISRLNKFVYCANIYWDRGRVDDRYNVAGVASGHIECAGYERGSFIYILGQRKGG